MKHLEEAEAHYKKWKKEQLAQGDESVKADILFLHGNGDDIDGAVNAVNGDLWSGPMYPLSPGSGDAIYTVVAEPGSSERLCFGYWGSEDEIKGPTAFSALIKTVGDAVERIAGRMPQFYSDEDGEFFDKEPEGEFFNSYTGETYSSVYDVKEAHPELDRDEYDNFVNEDGYTVVHWCEPAPYYEIENSNWNSIIAGTAADYF